MKSLIPFSKWVVVIGAVLYGLTGALNMDVLGSLFGSTSVLTMLVYWIVLLAGLWATYNKLIMPSKKKR